MNSWPLNTSLGERFIRGKEKRFSSWHDEYSRRERSHIELIRESGPLAKGARAKSMQGESAGRSKWPHTGDLASVDHRRISQYRHHVLRCRCVHAAYLESLIYRRWRILMTVQFLVGRKQRKRHRILSHLCLLHVQILPSGSILTSRHASTGRDGSAAKSSTPDEQALR